MLECLVYVLLCPVLRCLVAGIFRGAQCGDAAGVNKEQDIYFLPSACEWSQPPSPACRPTGSATVGTTSGIAREVVCQSPSPVRAATYIRGSLTHKKCYLPDVIFLTCVFF